MHNESERTLPEQPSFAFVDSSEWSCSLEQPPHLVQVAGSPEVLAPALNPAVHPKVRLYRAGARLGWGNAAAFQVRNARVPENSEF